MYCLKCVVEITGRRNIKHNRLIGWVSTGGKGQRHQAGRQYASARFSVCMHSGDHELRNLPTVVAYMKYSGVFLSATGLRYPRISYTEHTASISWQNVSQFPCSLTPIAASFEYSVPHCCCMEILDAVSAVTSSAIFTSLLLIRARSPHECSLLVYQRGTQQQQRIFIRPKQDDTAGSDTWFDIVKCHIIQQQHNSYAAVYCCSVTIEVLNTPEYFLPQKKGQGTYTSMRYGNFETGNLNL